jgi:hypothetical protein
MADHTIHFSPEQSLLLDKLMSDKAELQAEVKRLTRELEKQVERNQTMVTNVEYATRKRREAEANNSTPEEEEIRASERERIAIFFEMRGQEPDHFYQAHGNGVSMAAGDLARWIRNKYHYQTYREYRCEGGENWPEDYAKGPEDFDFNVDAYIWERQADDE